MGTQQMAGLSEERGRERLRKTAALLCILGLLALIQLSVSLWIQCIPPGFEIHLVPDFLSLVNAKDTGYAFTIYQPNMFVWLASEAFNIGLTILVLGLVRWKHRFQLILLCLFFAPLWLSSAELEFRGYRTLCYQFRIGAYAWPAGSILDFFYWFSFAVLMGLTVLRFFRLLPEAVQHNNSGGGPI